MKNKPKQINAKQCKAMQSTAKQSNARQSIAKTLRKPEEQLREFNKSGKVQLRKFLDNINAVETQMNGRINADTVILKAIK